MHTCPSGANVALMFTIGVYLCVLVYTVYSTSGGKLSFQESGIFSYVASTLSIQRNYFSRL